ncbi:penicillin-binding protein 1A [Halothiobacillus diazotrophicus]|uniref:penicillin-binding protein 1A n=1 Tax=Halothiobacillus diazotrophicus TaxID=1860122 RepID=UPI0009EE1154|nr:penicillin-binding protein 1A [Halothiobacillus diazotrophicus]
MKLIKFIVYVVGFLSIFVLGGVGVLYHVYNTQLPDVKELSKVQYQIPMRIFDADGGLVAEFGEKRRFPVTYDEIPKVVIDAFTSAEDDSFFEHGGVDVQSLFRAAYELIKTGHKGQGGSTITMQVARNFFLGREKTYSRKLMEILLAIKIEHTLTKQQILTLYLNKIFLGNRAYGVKAAAQVYFGKSLDQLSVAEAAMLASLPKAPSTVNPVSNPDRALARRAYVLSRMLALGHIDQSAYDRAMQAPLPGHLFASADIQTPAPFVAEMIRQKLVDQYGAAAYEMGLNVHTTIDPKAQAAARMALRDGLLAYDRRHGYRGPEDHWSDLLGNRGALLQKLQDTPVVGGLDPAVVMTVNASTATVLMADGSTQTLDLDGVRWACRYESENHCGPAPKDMTQLFKPGDLIRLQQTDKHWSLAEIPAVSGAFVALDPKTGAVRALVGGFDFAHDSKFNHVTQAERQPGSGFKPFLYSAALDHGFTWATLINDSPVVVKNGVKEGVDWRPQNYGKKFGGPMRMRMALVHSVNLVSIRLIDALGPETVLKYAARFGLPTKNWSATPSMALGSYALTPLELVGAFSTFVNGGYRVTPYTTTEVDNGDNAVLYSHPSVNLCDDCPIDSPDSSVAPRVITPQNAFLMRSALRDVVRMGTGVGAFRALKRNDIGGKTGTTNDQRDAWFTGFGPGWVATAWVGFDDNSPLGRREVGGTAALPIWVSFMRAVLPPPTDTPHVPPPGVEEVMINPDTGAKLPPGATGGVREYFDTTRNPADETPLSAPIPTDAVPQKLLNDLF